MEMRQRVRWMYTHALPLYFRRWFEHRWVLKYPRIYDEKHFIFVHIPKTAGKSILSMLDVKRATHLKLREYEELLGDRIRDYYIFAVVRDPVDRMLSLYNYLASGGNGSKEDRVLKRRLIDTSLNFNQFIERHLTRELIGSIRLFHRQIDYLTTDRVDFAQLDVIHFEQLDDAFTSIAERLQLEGSLPHVNVSRSHDSRLVISNATREKIYELYREDYVAFDYSIKTIGS